MITIEKLNTFGADTAEGLGRCFNNQGLYLKLVAMIPGEKNFGYLEDALNRHDLHAAFEAAHALKGVLGNLSLTPLYDPVSEMTELLRRSTETDYTPLLNTVMEKRAALAALCAD